MTQTLAPALKIQRHPERAVADRAAAFAILDEGLICHVGFVADGRPWVIPTMYAREGEVLYLHGSPASRMLRTLAGGIDMSVTVTLLDGLVLARSVFSHSMNYRSVVIAGTATEVVDSDEKRAAMRSLVEHVLRGRWDEVRSPSAKEMRTTLVLALPLAHLSTKVRTGPPIDIPADRTLPAWAGEIPVTLTFGTPQSDALAADAALPASVIAQMDKARR
ncbi:MAG TPA: pyridoxamine 5'-phosphate oxidase family protein [Candidatus Acidoferrales bacterium]|nr:pyridoxamine 5'-phosphate oxidase family protein [Candidatus Acidoferrales bacterium]